MGKSGLVSLYSLSIAVSHVLVPFLLVFLVLVLRPPLAASPLGLSMLLQEDQRREYQHSIVLITGVLAQSSGNARHGERVNPPTTAPTGLQRRKHKYEAKLRLPAPAPPAAAAALVAVGRAAGAPPGSHGSGRGTCTRGWVRESQVGQTIGCFFHDRNQFRPQVGSVSDMVESVTIDPFGYDDRFATYLLISFILLAKICSSRARSSSFSCQIIA